jgi:hypothetical protein
MPRTIYYRGLVHRMIAVRLSPCAQFHERDMFATLDGLQESRTFLDLVQQTEVPHSLRCPGASRHDMQRSHVSKSHRPRNVGFLPSCKPNLNTCGMCIFDFAKIERLFGSFLRVLFSKGFQCCTLKIPHGGTDTSICIMTSIGATMASFELSCDKRVVAADQLSQVVSSI